MSIPSARSRAAGLRAPIAALLGAAALVATGCASVNACPYGSKGGASSGRCRPRPAPDAGASLGYTRSALAARRGELLRRGIHEVVGMRVNRWGELWTTIASSRAIVVLDRHGRTIAEPKDDWESTGNLNRFSLSHFDPAGLPRALAELQAIDPSVEFASADLYELGVGEQGDLRWHIVVSSDRGFRTFGAAPNGQLLCESDPVRGGCDVPISAGR